MSEWVTIAHLTRARGNRGEVYALPLSSRSVEEFAELKKVFLFAENDPEGCPFEVESVWEHQTRGEGRLVFKFRGIDSISDAEQLAGREVRLPLAERAGLAEGEFYQSDLVGCEVVDRSAGTVIGRVSGLDEYGGTLLLKVAAAGGELLIPFARAICANIDVVARRIEVDLPEGLDKLNQ